MREAVILGLSVLLVTPIAFQQNDEKNKVTAIPAVQPPPFVYPPAIITGSMGSTSKGSMAKGSMAKGSMAQNNKIKLPINPNENVRRKDKVVKTDAEWRSQLTPMEYEVTRRAGTERAFTGKYWDHKQDGTYRCTCCQQETQESSCL